MTARRHPVIRLLERKDLPLLEIVLCVFIFSLTFLLVSGGVFRSDPGNKIRINGQRIKLLNMSVVCYRWANNVFPVSLSDLSCAGYGNGLCLPVAVPELLSDVWGTPYEYRPTGIGYELKSLGADKAEGGAGADADLVLSGP